VVLGACGGLRGAFVQGGRMITYFHFVRLHDVPKWIEAGWEETGDLKGTGHGDYSELMKWKRDGEPVIPKGEE
jgi:hypothetical protein